MVQTGAPEWPEDAYEIAKSDVLQRSNQFFALELHVVNVAKPDTSQSQVRVLYRVFTHQGDLSDTKGGTRECRYVKTVEEAEALYAALYTKLVRINSGYIKSCIVSPQCWIGSDKAVSERESSTTNVNLPNQVKVLVDLLYKEANNRLFNSINDYYIGKLTLPQLDKAEAILLQLSDIVKAKGSKPKLTQEKASQLSALSLPWEDEAAKAAAVVPTASPATDGGSDNDEVTKLSDEFYDAIKEKERPLISSIEAIAEKMDLVQLMKDMITVCLGLFIAPGKCKTLTHFTYTGGRSEWR